MREKNKQNLTIDLLLFIHNMSQKGHSTIIIIIIRNIYKGLCYFFLVTTCFFLLLFLLNREKFIHLIYGTDIRTKCAISN